MRRVRFAGMIFIVMNSTLLLHSEAFADQIKQQEGMVCRRLVFELEQGGRRA